MNSKTFPLTGVKEIRRNIYPCIQTEDQYELTEANIDFETNETFDDNENEKVPKNRKVDKRGRIVRHNRGAPRKEINDGKYEIVKKQCGIHGMQSMAIMLGKVIRRLLGRIMRPNTSHCPKNLLIVKKSGQIQFHQKWYLFD